MKIDPITVEKERFIAQYMFVADYIVEYVDWPGQTIDLQLNPERFHRVKAAKFVREFFVLLKDVKNITDEELVQVSKCLVPDDTTEEEIKAFIQSVADMPGYAGQIMSIFMDRNESLGEAPVSPMRHLAVYDYLRSRGYLVPWGGRSVEYILENNWARLI